MATQKTQKAGQTAAMSKAIHSLPGNMGSMATTQLTRSNKKTGATATTGDANTISGQLTRKYGTKSDYDRATNVALPDAEYRALLAEQKDNERMHEVAKGAAFGETVLGKEGLGRLGTDKQVQDVLARQNQISKTGMSDEESLMQREKALGNIGQGTATAEQALLARLGSRGVRGGVAGSQLAGIQSEGLQQRANVERDLYLQDEQIKREGLSNYASSLGQVKTFDLGQAAREKDIVLSSGLGFAGLASADKGAQAQADAARASAAAQSAASCFIGSELVKMKDGSYRKIASIDIGEETSVGTVYGKSQHLISTLGVVCYKGIYVSQDHPVYEDGVWMLVGNSKNAIRVGDENESSSVHVFDLWVTGERLEIKSEEGSDILFTDYEGINVHEINNQIVGELNEQNVVSISTGKICSRVNNRKCR